MPTEVRAFAPGRVNLIGEHTDYNDGLALAFAIAEGVTVRARAAAGPIRAVALDVGESEEFSVAGAPSEGRCESAHGTPSAESRRELAHGTPSAESRRELARGAPSAGWRAFVRGVVAELRDAGIAVPGAELEIRGDLPRGAGLSSSAALEVSLALALLALADAELDRLELARLCSRVENEWVGAHSGLLDQIASLFGEPDAALEIDFASLRVTPVPLVLGAGWRIVTLDSGEPHTLAASGYNERRAECARACELLGVRSLRELEERDRTRPCRADGREERAGALPRADRLPSRAPADPGGQPSRAAGSPTDLPEKLARRVRHVLGENARVRETVAALRVGDLGQVGTLLDASHASLRDLYECSTPAVEGAVARLREAGAAGARLVGGGFGGSVLGLFAPGARPPGDAREVRPSRGARLAT